MAAVVSIAVVGGEHTHVFEGPEPQLLRRLDALLVDLPAGVIVTWNGGGFDLPFLADRAARLGIELGLTLRHDPSVLSSRDPLPGHPGVYRGRWYDHSHLDGYRVYRADVGASLGWSCGLKAMARSVGLDPVEVDRERIHDLSAQELHDYVASDAYLARELVTRRWATARLAIDKMAADDAPANGVAANSAPPAITSI